VTLSRSTLSTLSLTALTTVALVGLSACNSKDDSAGSDTVTSATSAATSASKAATTAASPSAATSSAGGGSTAVAAGSLPTLTNPGPNDTKVSLSGNSFDPSSLTIKPGTIVTFTATDGKIHAVIVGPLSGATVYNGLIESFVFPGPGTFAVKDDVTTATMTITVKA
jgi:plastocyanin